MRELLHKYKELGYIVVIEHNAWIIKNKSSGKNVFEVHEDTMEKRLIKLRELYLKLTEEHSSQDESLAISS